MLAKIQANIIGEKLQNIDQELTIEYHTSTTNADRDIRMNISTSDSVGLFTKDISSTIINSIAEKDGVLQTALLAPAILSAGVLIPNFFHVLTRPCQFALFHRATIPHAPNTATAGVALNMNLAAVHDM